MTPNEIAITGIFLSTILLFVLAFKNSRTEQKNAESFTEHGELKSPMWILILLSAMALFGNFMALIVSHHSSKDDTWILSLISALCIFYAYVGSFYGIRFDSESIRYGFKCRKEINYNEITELQRDSNGKDAVYYVKLYSGTRIRLGSNFPCEKLILEEFQKRSGCKITRLRFGKPFLEIR